MHPLSPAAAMQMLLTTALVSSAGAFVLPCKKVLPFTVLDPSPTLVTPPHFAASSRRPSSSTILFLNGIFSDLEKIGDFDPEDEPSENIEEVLKLTRKVLNQLVDLEDSVQVREVTSKDLVAEDAAVSRRAVQTATSQPLGLFGLPIPLVKRRVDEDAVKKDAKRTFGEAIKLIDKILQRKITGKLGYKTYPNHPEFPNVDLSSAMKMMDGPPPLEYIFAPKKIVRLLKRVLSVLIGLAETSDDVNKAKTVEAMYTALFTKPKILGFFPNPFDLVPRPEHCMQRWEDDKELARQFLCGVNPVMIKVAKTLGELSGNLVDHFGSEPLQQLVDEKRLFYVSYDDLVDLKVNPHQAYPLPMNQDHPQNEPRYFYAPIALFVLDKERKELDILGIQLERTPDAPVYTKDNSDGNEWLLVKSCLTTADSQMHEWVSHLGNTHLTMEPHIIAIHNTLKKHRHPIYTFVKPLCKDTLLLNWAARQTLSSYGAKSFGDYVTSEGCGQFMQLIGKMWSRYSFFDKSGLPSELASRGFDDAFDMPSYLFREDGRKLWNAYGTFASDFVAEVYKSDSDVASDKILQEWAVETSSPDRGAVPGFPTSFQDKETLVKVLQTLMWMTSGLHAAVNFPQYDYLAFAPNKPLGARAPNTIPKSDSGASEREWIFANFFPHIDTQREVIKVVHLLTIPSDHCVDNLENEFPSIGAKSYATFQAKLDEIGDEIEARNKQAAKEKKGLYNYLNPSVVPASIDI